MAKFDADLDADEYVVDGDTVTGQGAERVRKVVDEVRERAGGVGSVTPSPSPVLQGQGYCPNGTGTAERRPVPSSNGTEPRTPREPALFTWRYDRPRPDRPPMISGRNGPKEHYRALRSTGYIRVSGSVKNVTDQGRLR